MNVSLNTAFNLRKGILKDGRLSEISFENKANQEIEYSICHKLGVILV